MEGWRLHDLRRVHRSLLSRCRVPFEIAERLLGHWVGVLAKTYDQHSHLPAMQEAVEKVAAEIARMLPWASVRARSCAAIPTALALIPRAFLRLLTILFAGNCASV